MWKIMLVHPEIMESEQPTWEIIKLIIQAQYSITAIGILVIVGLAIFFFTLNWLPVRKMVKDAKKQRDTIKEEQNKLKETFQYEIQMLKGEKDRLFALVAVAAQIWDNVVVWAGCAIEDYSKISETKYIKKMILKLIILLEKALKMSEAIEKSHKKDLLDRLNYIPDEFKDKKEEIRELINKLPEKEDEEEI